jgi:hypothetical protein
VQPSWYVQLAIVAKLVITLPFAFVQALITKSSNMQMAILFSRFQDLFHVNSKRTPKFNSQMFYLLPRMQNNTPLRMLMQHDYERQITKRLGHVEKLKHTNMGGKKVKVGLAYITVYDFCFVATFIAEQYVDYNANLFYQGAVVQRGSQLEPIDCQYLKHLEVIVQARYPTSTEPKVTYIVLLNNFLNDFTKAEKHLKQQQKVETTLSYKN